MYEHPVFCLASQVMDLTIREYLPHSPASPPPHTHTHTHFCTLLFTSYSQYARQLWVTSSFFCPVVLWLYRCFCLYSLVPLAWHCRSSVCLLATQIHFNLSVRFLSKPPALCLRFECIFTLLVCKSSQVFMLMVHPNNQPQYAFISISATSQWLSETNLEVTHSYCEHASVLEIFNHHHRIVILLANIIRILTDFNIFFRISLTRFQVKVTLCFVSIFSWMHFSCNKMQIKEQPLAESLQAYIQCADF